MPDGEASKGLVAVHDGLREALAGQPRIQAFWGPDLAQDPFPAAAALRAAGASWDWSALGFTGRSFWDLHVGILPVESGYSVGLHWTRALDHEVRPWAPIAVPQGALQFAAVAGEYQLLTADSTGITTHGIRSAVDVALAVATRVLSKITDDAHPAEVFAPTDCTTREKTCG
ncbi:hypothetical protein [Micromonospora sp. DT229]|uniref:hypothetical protein n=1 Tax=Micromonospora sp. DT229 TaxID=3393430 RepID=UPI003CE805F0